MYVHEAVPALGYACACSSVCASMRRLSQAQQWSDIRSTLVQLADYLDTVGVPIDYQRRRQLDYTGLLSDKHWTDIARATSTRDAGAGAARSFLYERLCGSPIEPGPERRDISVPLQHFPLRLTPRLLAELDRYALDFLAAQGINDEPVWWEPPRELIDGAVLPGTDVDSVDTTEMHRLLRGEKLSLSEIATRMGISRDAVRCVLEHDPAPKGSQWEPKYNTASRGPRAAYRRASSLFPRDRLAALCRQQHLSLKTLAATSARMLRERCAFGLDSQGHRRRCPRNR